MGVVFFARCAVAPFASGMRETRVSGFNCPSFFSPNKFYVFTFILSMLIACCSVSLKPYLWQKWNKNGNNRRFRSRYTLPFNFIPFSFIVFLSYVDSHVFLQSADIKGGN